MKTKANSKFSVFYKIRSAIYFPIGFYKYYRSEQLNDVKKKFVESLSVFKPNAPTQKPAGTVLIQVVKDYEYLIKLAAPAKVIAENNNLEVNFYDVDWTSKIGWGSKYKKTHDRFFTPALIKIYKSFGKKNLLNFEDDYHDQSFIKQKLTKCKTELQKPEDILNIKFENILVGDLLYDTYLRYFHQPTIENINEDVLLIIEIALNVFYKFTDFINTSKNVKALINIYSRVSERLQL